MSFATLAAVKMTSTAWISVKTAASADERRSTISDRDEVSSMGDTLASLRMTHLEVVDRQDRYVARGVEPEHLPEERQLGVERCHDRVGTAEAVSLTLVHDERNGQALGADGRGHLPRLARRDDPVVGSLLQQHGRVQPIEVVDRGALVVQVLAVGPGRDEPVGVVALELVGVGGQSRAIA